MEQLLPPGIAHVRDLPYTIFEAIGLTLVFLSFEELPKDEMPPRRIWMDGEALKSHFERIERKRREEYGLDPGGWDKSIEDPVQNEAAKDLIVG